LVSSAIRSSFSGTQPLDPAQLPRHLLPRLARRLDDLIGQKVAIDVNLSVLDDLVGHARLRSRDEEHPLSGQAIEPGEIDVAAVHDQNRSGLEAKLARDAHVSDPPLGNHGHRRQVAVMIEEQMQLHSPLGALVLRPAEHRRAQIDHRGVERQKLVLETELLLRPRRQLLAAPEQAVEDCLVELPGPVRVGVSERVVSRSWWKRRKAPSSGELVHNSYPLRSGGRRMTPWEAIAGMG
jgi:hypothetical protein